MKYLGRCGAGWPEGNLRADWQSARAAIARGTLWVARRIPSCPTLNPGRERECFFDPVRRQERESTDDKNR